MTERDKKHLEKLVKTTLASTPKDLSIIEPTDTDGCFSIYSIGNNDAPINKFTTEIFDIKNQEEASTDIKTVVISPNNSFMNGVEEITLNDFNIDNYDTNTDGDMNVYTEPIDINTDFNETFPMEMTEMDLKENFPLEIIETNSKEILPMEITGIELDTHIDMNMPEPIIDIFPENTHNEPIIEKKSVVLPKPSSIMSDMRSMNSRIDEKLERENDTVSSKKTGTASKSASVSIKQQEIPEQQHIKNITITQSNDTPTQTRQPNLKKKTDTSLNTQTQTPPPAPTGGGNPKYSFF